MDEAVAGTVDVDKLKRLLRERSLSPVRAAQAAGLGDTALKDILARRARSPRMQTLEAISAVLGVPIAAFVHGATPKMPSSTGIKSIKQQKLTETAPMAGSLRAPVALTAVVGIAEPNTWRAHPPALERIDMLPIPDAGLYGVNQRAYQMRGDSMAAAGLPDGSYAVAVDLGGDDELVDGMIVIAERAVASLSETAAWILRVHPDRRELHAPGQDPVIAGDDVRVVAKVVASYQPMRIIPR